MNIREIFKVFIDAFFITFVHFVLAYVISMAFFKVIFCFYEIHGFQIPEHMRMVCVVSGIFFIVMLKFFVTQSLSLSPPIPAERQEKRATMQEDA